MIKDIYRLAYGVVALSDLLLGRFQPTFKVKTGRGGRRKRRARRTR